MKTEISLKAPTKTIDQLTAADHIGFSDFEGNKGYFIQCADKNRYECISIDEQCSNLGFMNLTYGSGGMSVQDAFKETKKCSGSSQIVKLYQFTTRKELYKWLAED